MKRRGLFAGLIFVPFMAQAQVLDAIVARVDGQAITWSEVLQEREVRRVLGEPQADGSASRMLAALVRRRLFLLEASKLQLEPDPESVTAEEARRDAEPIPWDALARYGVNEELLRRRAREISLVRRYLALRREMTYVSEGELRTFATEHPDVFGERLDAGPREEARAFLGQRKHRRDLAEWVDRQYGRGRVYLLGLPEPGARASLRVPLRAAAPPRPRRARCADEGESAGQRFWPSDNVRVSFVFARGADRCTS